MKFSPIFDRHAQHLKVLSCDKGYVKCEMPVLEEHLNMKDGLSAISDQLWTSQNVYKVPLMVIYKKNCYAASLGRMDFKTKYSKCRHNCGRTRLAARF